MQHEPAAAFVRLFDFVFNTPDLQGFLMYKDGLVVKATDCQNFSGAM